MIARLFSPCLVIGHSEEQIRIRDAQGALHFHCARCHADLGPVLQSEMKKGPAVAQVPDLGAITTKARRVVKENVTEFPRQSQR